MEGSRHLFLVMIVTRDLCCQSRGRTTFMVVGLNLGNDEKVDPTSTISIRLPEMLVMMDGYCQLIPERCSNPDTFPLEMDASLH